MESLIIFYIDASQFTHYTRCLYAEHPNAKNVINLLRRCAELYTNVPHIQKRVISFTYPTCITYKCVVAVVSDIVPIYIKAFASPPNILSLITKTTLIV